ncbi:MAG TPA: antibiotic biosynthesis monooxygenase [Stellaceae bacterium]|nr:antibiotic biosynthesis monooxygenase [Stellaceae bacterium]
MGAMCLQAQAETVNPAVGSEEVYWVVTFSIPQGQMDKFKAVVAPLVADTKKELGALEYEYTASDDERTVEIVERYSNSAAVVSHVTQTFGPKYSKPFLEIAKLERFVVYGTPSAEAKEVLKGFNPVYMAPFDGFTRTTAAEATGTTAPPATK